MSRYSQGVCHDGAAILRDGQPMTIDEIVAELNRAELAKPAALHTCDDTSECAACDAAAKPAAVPDGWLLRGGTPWPPSDNDEWTLRCLGPERPHCAWDHQEWRPFYFIPPAPVVDVESVREVIADLNAVDRALWSDEVHSFADQLARAIGDEK